MRRLGLVAALLIAGCGGGAGGRDPEKVIETLTSWGATLQLARDDLYRGAITPTYARQLADRAREGRGQALQQLAKSPASADERASADSALRVLDINDRALSALITAR